MKKYKEIINNIHYIYIVSRIVVFQNNCNVLPTEC